MRFPFSLLALPALAALCLFACGKTQRDFGPTGSTTATGAGGGATTTSTTTRGSGGHPATTTTTGPAGHGGGGGSSGPGGQGGHGGMGVGGFGGGVGGFGEGGAGGSNIPQTCQGYCDAMTAYCTGASAMYANVEACLGSCATLPPGAAGDTSMNTLGCRIHYAGLARIDPTNCPAAGPAGANVCGTDCEGFCTIVEAACVNQNEVWPNYDTCKMACTQMLDTTPYSPSVMSGNNVACRLVAATIATTGINQATQNCGDCGVSSPKCM